MNPLAAKLKRSNNITVNDLTRRLGYSGGTPYMSIDPKYSGLRRRCVPGGELLYFVTGTEMWLGAYDKMKQAYPTKIRNITPKEQQYYVRKKFLESDDMGYRDVECLVGQKYGLTNNDTEYFDDAAKFFNVVHPPITCDFGLEAVYRTGAEGNVGAEWFQPCPTCRLASLQSDEIERRIEASDLDKNILRQLRDTLIEACQATIAFANRKIDAVNADLEKRAHGEPQGRTSRYEVDYIYLKMAHKTLDKKEPQPVDMAATISTAVATTLAAIEAQKAEKPVDPEYAKYLEWKASQEPKTETVKEPKGKKKEEVT